MHVLFISHTDAHLEPARMLMPQQQQQQQALSNGSSTPHTSSTTALLSLTPNHRRALLAFLEAASPDTYSLPPHHISGLKTTADSGTAATSGHLALTAPQLLPLLQLRCLAGEADVRNVATCMVSEAVVACGFDRL